MKMWYTIGFERMIKSFEEFELACIKATKALKGLVIFDDRRKPSPILARHRKRRHK